MISLSIAPLTKAGFAPFGEVVETADVKPKLINEGFAERFDDLANIDVAAEGGEVNISLFTGAARPVPLVIKLMERHPLGSQLFMPLNGAPWLVVVCTDPGRPLSYRAFAASGRQGVKLRAKLLAPSAARRRGTPVRSWWSTERGRAATLRNGGLKRQTG
jgi:ureidoglycolate lyase